MELSAFFDWVFFYILLHNLDIWYLQHDTTKQLNFLYISYIVISDDVRDRRIFASAGGGQQTVQGREVMYRIAIVDDDRFMGQQVKERIEQNFESDLFQMECFTAASQLLSEMEEEWFTVYILDIEMPGVNGLELAEQIRKRQEHAYIIFLTAYEKYALLGYEVRAYHYIIKENMTEKLVRTLQQICRELGTDIRGQYLVKSAGAFEKVALREIYYIYKEQKNSIFVTGRGEKTNRESLKEVRSKLPEEQFVVAERGYIVNLLHVSRMEKGMLTMEMVTRLKSEEDIAGKSCRKCAVTWKEGSHDSFGDPGISDCISGNFSDMLHYDIRIKAGENQPERKNWLCDSLGCNGAAAVLCLETGGKCLYCDAGKDLYPLCRTEFLQQNLVWKNVAGLWMFPCSGRTDAYLVCNFALHRTGRSKDCTGWTDRTGDQQSTALSFCMETADLAERS